MARFLASNNFTKNENLTKYFPGGYITSLDICHRILSARLTVIVKHQLLALLLNPAHFGHFVPASTQFLQLFLGSKKSSWDDEIMMSCTRIYVDLTYSMMSQRGGKKLLSLLGQ